MEAGGSEEWVDFYAVLGLEGDVVEKGEQPSKETVSKRFRKLALKFHPDKQAKATEEQRILIGKKYDTISKANEALQDDERREKFHVEYMRRQEEMIRMRKLDEKSRAMELDLITKERAAESEKKFTRQKEEDEYRTLLWIQEQDRLFKREMLEKYGFAPTGADREAEKANVSDAGLMKQKDINFYSSIFDEREQEILDALS